MPLWLGHWISNPGTPGSKSLGGSKIKSGFHSSLVNKMSMTNLVVKSRLSPHFGSVVLDSGTPSVKMSHKGFFW